MPKLTKHINWKYALGEVFLIFIGITAALYFNNWNEVRKKVSLEKETLLEIYQGVSADLDDINNNIRGYTFRKGCYQYVFEHIDQHKSIDQPFLDTIRYFKGFTYFISNTGPYETLKSRGLGLISNKKTRLAIAEYYDQKQEWLQVSEIKHHEFYENKVVPMLLKHFEVANGFLPYQYDVLLNDKEAHQILYWSINDMSFMINQYRSLAKEAEAVLLSIEEEIGRPEE